MISHTAPTRRARLKTHDRKFWVAAADGDSLAYVVPTWTCRGCNPQSGPIPGRRRRRRRPRRPRKRGHAGHASKVATPEPPVDEPWRPELDDEVLYDGSPYTVIGRMDDVLDLLGCSHTRAPCRTSAVTQVQAGERVIENVEVRDVKSFTDTWTPHKDEHVRCSGERCVVVEIRSSADGPVYVLRTPSDGTREVTLSRIVRDTTSAHEPSSDDDAALAMDVDSEQTTWHPVVDDDVIHDGETCRVVKRVPVGGAMLYTLRLPDDTFMAVRLHDVRSIDTTWTPVAGDPVRWKCRSCFVETVEDDGTCTVSTGDGSIHDTTTLHLTRPDRSTAARHRRDDDDNENNDMPHVRDGRDAARAFDENPDSDNDPVRYTGPRDRSQLAHRRSIFNLSVPPPTPRCIAILTQAERMMITRASVCLAIHNRVSDTRRPMSSSHGLATVLPMDCRGGAS